MNAPLPPPPPPPHFHGAADRQRRFRRLSFTVAVLLVCLAWLALSIMKPAVQRRLVISAGAVDGIYYNYAKQYARLLAREGITLDIRTSSGAEENYARIKRPDSRVDIAFVQSGIGNAADAPNLQTIAAVAYEPIWVFYRGPEKIDRLSQLAGKRIASGPLGSGLRTVAHDLLRESGVGPGNATLIDSTGRDAFEAMQKGTLDASFFVGRPETPLLKALLNSDLKLMNFAQADAMVRRFTSLSTVIYPRGALNLAADLPPHDIRLIAITAMLVSRDSVHPALSYLLLDSATMVHAGADYFTPRNYFPNQDPDDFPMADESVRFFKYGRPFLQRYLPFWLANFIEHRFLILLPFMAILFGAIQACPRIYAYLLKRRLIVSYRALQDLEEEILDSGTDAHVDSARLERWRADIEAIEERAASINLPGRFLSDEYALKLAIRAVRDRVAGMQARAALTDLVGV